MKAAQVFPIPKEVFCAWKDAGSTFSGRFMPPVDCIKKGCVGGPFTEAPGCKKFIPLVDGLYAREERPDRQVVLKGISSKE